MQQNPLIACPRCTLSVAPDQNGNLFCSECKMQFGSHSPPQMPPPNYFGYAHPPPVQPQLHTEIAEVKSLRGRVADLTAVNSTLVATCQTLQQSVSFQQSMHTGGGGSANGAELQQARGRVAVLEKELSAAAEAGQQRMRAVQDRLAQTEAQCAQKVAAAATAEVETLRVQAVEEELASVVETGTRRVQAVEEELAITVEAEKLKAQAMSTLRGELRDCTAQKEAGQAMVMEAACTAAQLQADLKAARDSLAAAKTAQAKKASFADAVKRKSAEELECRLKKKDAQIARLQKASDQLARLQAQVAELRAQKEVAEEEAKTAKKQVRLVDTMQVKVRTVTKAKEAAVRAQKEALRDSGKLHGDLHKLRIEVDRLKKLLAASSSKRTKSVELKQLQSHNEALSACVGQIAMKLGVKKPTPADVVSKVLTLVESYKIYRATVMTYERVVGDLVGLERRLSLHAPGTAAWTDTAIVPHDNLVECQRNLVTATAKLQVFQSEHARLAESMTDCGIVFGNRRLRLVARVGWLVLHLLFFFVMDLIANPSADVSESFVRIMAQRRNFCFVDSVVKEVELELDASVTDVLQAKRRLLPAVCEVLRFWSGNLASVDQPEDVHVRYFQTTLLFCRGNLNAVLQIMFCRIFPELRPVFVTLFHVAFMQVAMDTTSVCQLLNARACGRAVAHELGRSGGFVHTKKEFVAAAATVNTAEKADHKIPKVAMAPFAMMARQLQRSIRCEDLPKNGHPLEQQKKAAATAATATAAAAASSSSSSLDDDEDEHDEDDVDDEDDNDNEDATAGGGGGAEDKSRPGPHCMYTGPGLVACPSGVASFDAVIGTLKPTLPEGTRVVTNDHEFLPGTQTGVSIVNHLGNVCEKDLEEPDGGKKREWHKQVCATIRTGKMADGVQPKELVHSLKVGGPGQPQFFGRRNSKKKKKKK